MKKTSLDLSQNLLELVQKHMVMLQPEGMRNRQALKLRVSGYNEAMHLIADIVKVSILALSADEPYGQANIPEPNMHVCGVLALILDLLPYEETQLLDMLHESAQQAQKRQNDIELQGNYSTIRILKYAG